MTQTLSIIQDIFYLPKMETIELNDSRLSPATQLKMFFYHFYVCLICVFNLLLIFCIIGIIVYLKIACY